MTKRSLLALAVLASACTNGDGDTDTTSTDVGPTDDTFTPAELPEPTFGFAQLQVGVGAEGFSAPYSFESGGQTQEAINLLIVTLYEFDGQNVGGECDIFYVVPEVTPEIVSGGTDAETDAATDAPAGEVYSSGDDELDAFLADGGYWGGVAVKPGVQAEVSDDCGLDLTGLGADPAATVLGEGLLVGFGPDIGADVIEGFGTDWPLYDTEAQTLGGGALILKSGDDVPSSTFGIGAFLDDGVLAVGSDGSFEPADDAADLEGESAFIIMNLWEAIEW